ncbi:OVARIAN TUMOR DOMAIN-containing deubiquitinating enzyme 4-like [Oryza brachyantha]|uniref:Ubiquitin thioesterase OTU n=1 Tax=Oryza brachyantha TaxID=4533 RepID=J3MU96_ORYBR|nr:OVARIAN TUMOR DOMAIN-containing deubiquitinating enzyme 4-like [Oryza brachyantha]XP_015695845.1 OVARIAN TUMOR DOMAIN-containing deubiquitinating enzyme 4-like [Oryza brachyantha]XP_015695847.1 OVARIAN TUMOR DOMAIN-containing deubiquitinating enzyme 4-like [Oryza brachyantha]
MRLYSYIVNLRRSSKRIMYSQSSQFHGGLTQGLALRKCSQSQSPSYHVKLGPVDCFVNRNIKSSERPSLRYFASLVGRQFRCGLSGREGSLNMKMDMHSRDKFSSMNWNWRGLHHKIGGTAGGLFLGFAVSGIANNEVPVEISISDSAASSSSTHGKEVYTDYSVTGIAGDGRCLFRSLIHGACFRAGRSIPNEDLQRKLADELRAMVADEFIKRREESEWFVEGDFDTYVSHIRHPHVWGGEPELLMASHVLEMPITVYMHDDDAGGLIAIAEYGQQYGEEDPIQVLYDGFGHYDALQIPAKGAPST